MACKKNCRKFFLRGENACERCKDRESCAETEEEVDEGEDLEDEDLEDEDESDEDDEEEETGDCADEFGHYGKKHLYRVPFKLTHRGVKFTGKIEVAADSEDEAKEFVNDTPIDKILADTSILVESDPKEALECEPGFYDVETEVLVKDAEIEVDPDGEVERDDDL